jgi:hypothetical protein
MRTFLKLLDNAPAGAVFNPWRERDIRHDVGPDGPTIRRDQLTAYLAERRKATVILLAEALGYQGGHFSGIAMTSERLLLGHLRHKGLGPEMVFAGQARRTSREDVKPGGFTEPTATIVWGAMHELGLDTREVILWNAFPWHPYKPETGLLSNRTPCDEEVMLGQPVLKALMAYASRARVLAVGQKSAALLAAMGITAPALRHPANGGAGRFRAQFAQLMKKG